MLKHALCAPCQSGTRRSRHTARGVRGPRRDDCAQRSPQRLGGAFELLHGVWNSSWRAILRRSWRVLSSPSHLTRIFFDSLQKGCSSNLSEMQVLISARDAWWRRARGEARPPPPARVFASTQRRHRPPPPQLSIKPLIDSSVLHT